MSPHPNDPARPPTAPYRPAGEVMRLARMGAMHQTRLSFMRVLLRRAARERWHFERKRWEMDERGVGTAVYSATTPESAATPERTYSLVAFAHDLPPNERSDRVIATAWDATFTLFDGVPSDDDLARLKRNVPLQEAGRVSERELILSRANRSVRLFAHVVERLARGEQPDAEMLDSVGYLMRTTAVYGSGKFGAADREQLLERDELRGPFQAEMLAVYLVRWFSLDIVEHCARVKGGTRACELAPELARRLGIGNSTGLGMAPFLMRHPVLLNNWMTAREEAYARVRALPVATPQAKAIFTDRLARLRLLVENWHSDHEGTTAAVGELRCDLARVAGFIEPPDSALEAATPWEGLHRRVCELGLEASEAFLSLALEPYGALVDGLADCMHAEESELFPIDGSLSVVALRELLEREYGWALALDFDDVKGAGARAWYVSAEKLEPRLGDLEGEPHLAGYERPLAPGRDCARLYAALGGVGEDSTIAEFLLARPIHRHAVRRVLLTARFPYAEIRDNTIDAKMLPIDLLRCKLSFFGATRFDPRSDRWVRICMYQGAPLPWELSSDNADDWIYPTRNPLAADAE